LSWADEEFRGINLGDARRNSRAARLLERFAERPTASIPGACGGWAETQAAYRFLSSEVYDWLDILAPHRACTQARMAEHAVVLCLQDTTELDFNGQAIAGLGPLSYEAQRGMYLHPSYAVSVQREPLGVLDAWMWAREPKAADGTRPGVRESVRWSEGYARVAELAATSPATRLVYVADREADLQELMVRAHDLGTPADWLVRAKHNRALPDGQRLWAKVLASAPLGEVCFRLPAGRGRTARSVRQQLYAQRIALPDGRGATFEVTCLIAREIGAPPGVKPIEWRLLSNRVAATLAAVVELIDWYRARWEIELLFLVLKEGCRIEALQLGTMARIERALALFLVVAWRIARLMRLGRTLPDLQVGLLLEPEEWQAAYLLAKKPLPKQPPRLNEALRLIARLGGFLARKGDGEPGVKTIWLGLQRVMDFVAGIKFAREAHRL
jgi:Transposase Tn5 dimerisation domain/Transposase DNA-binding